MKSIILFLILTLQVTNVFAADVRTHEASPARSHARNPSDAIDVINEATIHSLQTAIQNQEITCVAVVQAYLERIKQYNLSVNDKPPINAFTQINPYVLLDAQKLDDYFAKHHQLQGPLHCVPVIVKDNINTQDMQTTGASFSLLGNQPNNDAFIVQKLRHAGAILIGKGGMDEFGWGLVGINSRTGRIGNAYDPSKNPGGSSGGVAASVAANFALVGIGTDNSGSIRVPAAFNGVFGLRPSTGLISQHGIIPMGNLDAVAGPIARSVTDLAIVLSVMAEENDSKDPKTQHMPMPRFKNYNTVLKENALQGKRIGIVRKIGKKDPFKNLPEEAQTLFNASLMRMQKNGAVIIDAIHLPDYITDRVYSQAGEWEDVDEYLATFPATRKNFKDICQSNRTRTFGNSAAQCIRFIQQLPARNSKEYKQVLHIFEQNKKYVENTLKEQNIDALILPVTRDGSATYEIYAMNTWVAPLASNAGLPSIVLNAGLRPSNGMPVGIELIAKQFNEPLLIAMAYAYEQKSPKHIPPTLLESRKSFVSYSIADMNNLFTLLGADAYDSVLRDRQSSDLTPEVFRDIFVKTVQKLE